MSHDPVSRVEESVTVVVSPKCLLGIFNEIFDSECVTEGIIEWHTSRLDAVIGKIMPRKGIPMGDGENGHFHADKSVLDSRSKVVAGVALNVVGDDIEPD